MKAADIEVAVARIPELEEWARDKPEWDQMLAAQRETGEALLLYLRTPWWQVWALPGRFRRAKSASQRLEVEAKRFGW